MTKTQPNRIITYIMNLWANRLGQLAMLAVALFFFSCQEDTSVLGFRNPNSKFQVSFVEIPIESSIYLRDSLRTSNFSYSGEVNRFMVGSYTDDVFGDISSTAFSQYFSTNITKLGETAEFDSVTLELRYDLYTYGESESTPQTLGIYELDQELKSDSLRFYFNRSKIAYSTMIGSKSFTIDPQIFKDFAASSTDADTVITLNVPLDGAFGQRIFDKAIQYRDATTKEDSAFVYYNEFVKEFKGIAIKPESSDKIFGFNPAATQSKITVHYHEADEDSLSFSLALTGVIGFNQISANRSVSELAEVSDYYQEYQPLTDNRYIQSGIGILTKLDFSKFYEFADTVPNMLINSAELIIETTPSDDFDPPAGLALRVLKENNRIKKYSTKNSQDVSDYQAYRGYLLFDITTSSGPPLVEADSAFYVNDRNALLAYSSATHEYRGSFPLFFQQLTLDNEKTMFMNFVLYPYSQTANRPLAQSAAKSVNRVVFPKENIKLRIFYTKPTTTR